jgi:hypothetical protein
MTFNISNATYGQHPYFDNSTPDFDQVGETYEWPIYYAPGSAPTIKSGGKAILYGSSLGSSRKSVCIRRYVYQYNIINNIFSYYKTYKGVRNFEQPDNVIDVGELNSRSLTHSTETAETEPIFITQTILQSLFSFPSNGDYFFIEGCHSIRFGDPNQGDKSRPNFFKIYRYGKITHNNIVLVYKNNNIERRQ